MKTKTRLVTIADAVMKILIPALILMVATGCTADQYNGGDTKATKSDKLADEPGQLPMDVQYRHPESPRNRMLVQSCGPAHPSRGLSPGDVIQTPHFRDNYDGTIDDPMTGLMWDRCALGQDGHYCDKPTVGARGLLFEHERLRSELHLIRERGHKGYKDWRIPTVDELQSIVFPLCQWPAIKLEAFPRTYAYGSMEIAEKSLSGKFNGFWSSDEVENWLPPEQRDSDLPDSAQYKAVDFGTGATGYFIPEEFDRLRVRLVRGKVWVAPKK